MYISENYSNNSYQIAGYTTNSFLFYSRHNGPQIRSYVSKTLIKVNYVYYNFSFVSHIQPSTLFVIKVF